MFGTDAWRTIYERRQTGQLTAAEAKEEYVNLMRWRLVHDLGYAKTHPFELKNTRGGISHMIFATDNAAGDHIMADLYTAAARNVPAMQQEARDRQTGQVALQFDDRSFASATYEHAPPREPPSAA